MSYTPIEWETGDVVTAEKLNKMDEEISNSANPFLIEFNEFNSSTTTYDEIIEAVNDGKKLYAVIETEVGRQYSEVDEMVMSNGAFVGRCCFTTPEFSADFTVTPQQYTVCVITSIHELFTVINGATIRFNDLNELLATYDIIVTEDVSVAEYVTDKTYAQIHQAIRANRPVFFVKAENGIITYETPVGIYENPSSSSFRILMANGDFYETDEPDTVMQYHPW